MLLSGAIFDCINPGHPGYLPCAREGGEPPPGKGGDIDLSNIIKLIPGDVVAIYLAGRTAVAADKIVLGLTWPLFLTLACLLVCLILRYLATRTAPAGPNWWLVGVTALAFLIWAHAVYPTAPGPIIADFYGSIAGVIAMLFAVVAPKLVPAEPDP